MRLDDYLSTVRLIKRRTIAKQMIEGGKVKLNGKASKPSSPVNTGDYIRFSRGNETIEVEITDLPMKSVRKEDCEKFYKRLI